LAASRAEAGRGRKREREGGGGLGPVPRGRREMGERERGLGVSVGSARRRNVADNGPQPSGSGDTVVAEQGRAAGRGRRVAVVSGGVWEEGSKVRQRGGGALTGRPKPHSAGAQFKFCFKSIQEYSSGSNKI
jgi:hypothetical protein